MNAAQQQVLGVVPSVVDLAGQILQELPRADFSLRIAIRKRVRELIELAKEDGFLLPLPAGWIAKLELHGYVVDLETGNFLWGGDGEACVPTAEAWALRKAGEL